MATDKATSAFLTLRDIHSLNNITYIQEIVNSLLESSYGNHKEVKKLAQMVAHFYQAYKEKQP